MLCDPVSQPFGRAPSQSCAVRWKRVVRSCPEGYIVSCMCRSAEIFDATVNAIVRVLSIGQ